VVGTHIVFILNLGEISYFDCHRCFLPSDHPFKLDSNSFKEDNIILKGPPRHLSNLEIADMLNNLVLDENEDQFVRYGKKYNWTHKYGIMGAVVCQSTDFDAQT
jgi:hypothetical protein